MSNDAARSKDQRLGTPAPHECFAIDPLRIDLGSLGLSVKVWPTKVCHFKDLGWVSIAPRWASFHLYYTRTLSVCE